MGWYEQLITLFVLFLTINTLTVGLRLYTRVILTKGAFGWDDVVLLFTHVSLHRCLLFRLKSLSDFVTVTNYGQYLGRNDSICWAFITVITLWKIWHEGSVMVR